MATDYDTVRGGLDSLAWLLNNAHAHDTPRWNTLVQAAREDRDAALEALKRLTEERDAVTLTLEATYDELQRVTEQRDDARATAKKWYSEMHRWKDHALTAQDALEEQQARAQGGWWPLKRKEDQ